MPLNQVEIRTEEIDEILGKTPNTLIRWGTTIIFAIIVLILVSSWFFKYPDFVNANIEITTINPPADIIAKTNGKLEYIFVNDKKYVSIDEVLAVIANPAEYDDVIKLNIQLDSFPRDYANTSFINKHIGMINGNLNIGELQVYYSNFQSAYLAYFNFVQLGYYIKKIKALKQQYHNQNKLFDHSQQQKLTLENDLALSKLELERYGDLFQDKTIPEAEYEKIKSRFLQKKYAFEGAKTNLTNIQIQITQLENNILDLELQHEQLKAQLIQNLDENYDNLLGHIAIWEDKYVLISPIDGICSFTKYWNVNQNVKSGEKVMTIIPKGKPDMIGKLLLPVEGSGKVKEHQKVNVKLQNFPYMEYGIITGNINNISLIPNDSFYYVEVTFPMGLTTNYGNTIEFSQNLQGTAEIITDDKRLLHRFIEPLRSIWKSRIE